MARRVVITGLGPLSAIGVGIDATWQAIGEGRCGIAPIQTFDPAGFSSRIAGEVRDFKVTAYVPKSYRKAVKVMARDIEFAVACADLAARDAKFGTRGTLPDPGPGQDLKTSYDPRRVGAHVGAGLIAAELNELTDALVTARGDQPDKLDMHKWGSEGMTQLTPLWLLKYLPNMLACHVTIIHDTQGPSNTITCGESSGELSIGESLRVIQRGAADACFCGGTESKLNPMAFLRQIFAGRVNTTDNDRPSQAVRPFSADAAGTVIGEGGGIIVIEAKETLDARAAREPGVRAYAEIKGFGAAQTIHPESRNLKPDPQGRGIALAIRAALRNAGISPDEIDAIIPIGLSVPEYDRAEMAALREIFGDRLSQIPLCPLKQWTGTLGAGTGGLNIAVAAKSVAEQKLPRPGHPAHAIRNLLTYGTSLGGQNAAVVLGKV